MISEGRCDIGMGTSMKKHDNLAVTDKKKVMIITVLFAVTIVIMFLGIFFSVFSVLNNISIPVLSSSVHGIVFGLLVFYLGIRYFLSVVKLKTEVYKDTSVFTWGNFRKRKS
jgi:hypothetical protein